MKSERQLLLSPFVLAPSLIGLVIVLFFLPSGLRLIPGLIYFIALSWALGERLFSSHNGYPRLALGALFLISMGSLVSTAAFYIYKAPTGFFFILAALFPLLLFLQTKPLTLNTALKKPSLSGTVLALKSAHVLSAIGIIALLIKYQTFSSIVSPWIVLPSLVFLIYATQLALLFALFKKNSLTWLNYAFFVLTSLSVTTIVFPLGYGFDPFIHSASQQLLITSGTISPKPFYYIGYYVITAWIHLLTGLSVIVINKLLTLTAAVLFLPLILRFSLRELIGTHAAALAPILFFIIPHPELIQSTPLSLAYMWLIIVIAFTIKKPQGARPSLLPWIITLTALAMHPLVGIPAILYLAYKLLPHNRSYLRLIRPMTLLATIFAVPLALTLAAFRSPELNSSVTFSPTALINLIPETFRVIVLDDLIYSYNNSVAIVVIILSIIGILAIANKQKIQSLILFSSATFASGLILLLFVSFNFGSAQEQGIFATRLFIISLYFATPLFLVGAMRILSLSKNKTAYIMVATLCIFMSISAWYLSYPRFDTRSQNKGYTASRVDYQAIHRIDDIEHDNDYVVLANQTVSAVAVQELGFAQYHNGQFYYPIPTNSPLHKQFTALLSLSSPIDAIISDVKNSTGVDHIYVIVNDYWTDSDAITKRLTEYASAFTRIKNEDGGLTILRY